MPIEDGQFKKGETPPNRGKSFKNKLLDVIKEESLLDCTPSSSKETCERAFLKHWSVRAFDPKGRDSATLLKELGNKSYPSLKPTMPVVNFDFSSEATPIEQANSIIQAASDGVIPPDVAKLFIDSIASLMRIEEITLIAERLTKIEQSLGVDNA